MPCTTSGQEMEWVNSYNPGARTGPVLVQALNSKCDYFVIRRWRCQVQRTRQDMTPPPCDQLVLL